MTTALGQLQFTAISPLAAPVAVGEKVAFTFRVCPGATVVLLATPVNVNPAPTKLTLEIVTLAFPTLVSVAPCESLLPSNTFPNSRLATLELKPVVAVTALAVAEIVSGEFGASLTSNTDPVAGPAESGAKSTLNVALFPGPTFAGIVSPLTLKPAPVTVALEIVASAVPLLSSVIVCELLDPVATFGKLALLGLAASCACPVLLAVGALGLPAGWLEDLDGALEAPTTPAHPLSPSNATLAATRAIFAVARYDLIFLTLPLLTSDPASIMVTQVWKGVRRRTTVPASRQSADS